MSFTTFADGEPYLKQATRQNACPLIFSAIRMPSLEASKSRLKIADDVFMAGSLIALFRQLAKF